MEIRRFATGPFQTNCYLVWNDKKEAYFFDCEGERLNRVEETIEKEGLTLKYIILTHGHGDHICGLNRLKEIYPEATVYIGEEEKEFLDNNSLNLAPNIIGRAFHYNGGFRTLTNGDRVGDFTVIDTPGHTIGSKCFYNKESKILISGDTMFRRSFGRYDLPTSSGKQLFDSLAKLCAKLPEDTVVYSGHTEPTTIGEEKIFLTHNGLI